MGVTTVSEAVTVSGPPAKAPVLDACCSVVPNAEVGRLLASLSRIAVALATESALILKLTVTVVAVAARFLATRSRRRTYEMMLPPLHD